MKSKRFTEEQIVRILHEAEAGIPVTDVCRKHNCSEQSFYRWKAKYGGDGCIGSEAAEGARAGERGAEEDGGGTGPGHSDVEGCECKKVVSLAERRRCVTYLRNGYEISERRACQVMQMNRSSYRYVGKTEAMDERYRRAVSLSRQYAPVADWPSIPVAA